MSQSDTLSKFMLPSFVWCLFSIHILCLIHSWALYHIHVHVYMHNSYSL